MKFKKDGNVFEDIEEARCEFCAYNDCISCPMNFRRNKFKCACIDAVQKHPAEAARLMGYEVVEEDENLIKTIPMKLNEAIEHLKAIIPQKDWSCEECKQEHEQLLSWLAELKERREQDQKEADMDKQKPRICEVLGVELGQRFNINYPYRAYDALEVRIDGKVWETGKAAHKLGVNALCYIIENPDKIIRAPRFTEEDVADAKAIMRVFQCNELLEIVRGNISDELFLDYGTGPEDVGLNHKLFPSIRPGQSVKLSEIVGGTGWASVMRTRPS